MRVGRNSWFVDRGSEAPWRVLIEEGPCSGVRHMAYDRALAGESAWVARFFRWSPPAVSLGLKQEVPGWLDEKLLCAAGVELVERPTGGGLALHGSDLSIAVVVPMASHASLQVLIDAVCSSASRLCSELEVPAVVRQDGARERCLICLAEPTPYALMMGARKLAGFALRRTSGSWLIQGSLLINRLPEAL